MNWILSIALCIISAFVGLTVGSLFNRNKNSHKTPCESHNLFKVEFDGFKKEMQDKFKDHEECIRNSERRLNEGEKRFQAIEKVNIGYDAKLTRIDEKLEEINKNVTGLQTLIIKNLKNA